LQTRRPRRQYSFGDARLRIHPLLNERRASFRLDRVQLRNRWDSAQLDQLAETQVQSEKYCTSARRSDDVRRWPPFALLGNLVCHRFCAVEKQGVPVVRGIKDATHL